MKRLLLLLLFLFLIVLNTEGENFKVGQTFRVYWNVFDPSTGVPVAPTSGVELRLYDSAGTQLGSDIAMTLDSVGRYYYSWTGPSSEGVYYATFTWAYDGTDYWYTGYYFNFLSDSVIVDVSSSTNLINAISDGVADEDTTGHSNPSTIGGRIVLASDTSLYANVSEISSVIADTLEGSNRFLYYLASYWGVVPGDTTIYYPNDGTSRKDSVVVYDSTSTKKVTVIFKHSNDTNVMDSTIIIWGSGA